MNRLKNTGLVLCGLALGLSLSAPAAQAVESLKATLSTNRILVDGQETHMTAYTIGGSNYVRLRDIGKAVDFEVYWDSENGCVQVESGKPYTGEEPAKDEVIKPTPQPEPTVPANDADVDAMKQDIVDRTNAIRREQGISALTDELIHFLKRLYASGQTVSFWNIPLSEQLDKEDAVPAREQEAQDLQIQNQYIHLYHRMYGYY